MGVNGDRIYWTKIQSQKKDNKLLCYTVNMVPTLAVTYLKMT